MHAPVSHGVAGRWVSGRLGLGRIPPGYAHRKEWAEQGSLFSYGPDYGEVGRVGARYVDRILRGAEPADRPVEQLDTLELVVSLKAAQALGLAMPR